MITYDHGIEFKALKENYEQMINFIEANIIRLNVSPKIISDVVLASEEILVNIIEYSYSENPGNLWIDMTVTDEKIEIVFSDEGKKFNPLNNAEPDLSKPLEEREVGGLGIFIVKKLVDSIEYCCKDGKNYLTIQKQLLK